MVAIVKTIPLSLGETMIGGQIGIMRQVTNIREGRKHAHGANHRDNPFENHINGALGEMAVGKYFNRFWSGALGNLGVADVDGLQVRATPHQNGRLICHPSDKDGDIFICARIDIPLEASNGILVHLAGWLFGREAKLPVYWKEVKSKPGRPAFFVDNEALRDLDELRALIDDTR